MFVGRHETQRPSYPMKPPLRPIYAEPCTRARGCSKYENSRTPKQLALQHATLYQELHYQGKPIRIQRRTRLVNKNENKNYSESFANKYSYTSLLPWSCDFKVTLVNFNILLWFTYIAFMLKANLKRKRFSCKLNIINGNTPE